MAVPKIRFPGFTEDWEQRKLGEFADIVTGKLDANAMKADGKYDFYTSGIQKYRIDVPAFEGPAITIAGNGATVGYMHLADGKFNAYQRTYVLSSFKANREFLFFEIGNKLPQKIAKEARTGNIPYIVKDMLTDLVVSIPSELEQKKIGAFFLNLDSLITLHQRKLESMKLLKKSLLQKMFPKSGETVPEVRFPGFTDAWEQRKLESLCIKFTDGDWIEAKDQSDSGVRLVQTGNVGVTEYLDKPNNKKWISEETFNRLHCEEVLPGDILISRLPEPAGRACIMPALETKMITAVDCTIVRTAPEINNKFLVQYLSSQSYFKEVNTCLAGGTRQRISRSNLANFDIPVPTDKAEQDAIGEFLDNLDNLITLHQRKVEALQKLKKSLLQQMFV